MEMDADIILEKLRNIEDVLISIRDGQYELNSA
jgi:hypothetical protein